MSKQNRNSIEAVSPSKLFCFGLGYTALNLANRLKYLGWEISGTTRNPEKYKSLKNQGIRCMLIPDEPVDNIHQAVRESSCILISIPPQGKQDWVLEIFKEDIARSSNLQWLGYLSTTGVYGNHDGEWVDEETPPQPNSERSFVRAQVEKQWLELFHESGLPVHLFRLVGIYGPGRGMLARLLKGTMQRIDSPGQLFSHIHVDDIVQVLTTSIGQPNPGSVYNLCDDTPVSQREAVEYACQLLKMEPPPLVALEDSNLGPLGKSFYLDRKRVSNNKLKSELGVELIFPDYFKGLESLIKNA